MSNVAKLKKRALDYEQKKQVDKALETYALILQDLGDHVEEADVALYNRVGDLLLRRGDVAGAVDHYERAVDLYADGGFFNNAIALCNKILRNAPGRNSIYYKLGRISAQKGFVNDAKQNFLEYADRMQRIGQLEEAFRALKEFADLCPDQDDIRLMLADQLVRKERKAEAVEQLQLLYEKFQSEGRTQEARATVERMKALDPELEPTAAAARPTPKGNDLVFLDVDFDQPFTSTGSPPAPGRASGPAQPPRRSAPSRSREVPKPIADLPLIYEGPEGEPESEVASLEGLTESNTFAADEAEARAEPAVENRADDGLITGFELTSLDAPPERDATVPALDDLQPGSTMGADAETPSEIEDESEDEPDPAEARHIPREPQMPDVDEPPVRLRPREPVLHDSDVPPARFRLPREPQLPDVDEPPIRFRPRPGPTAAAGDAPAQQLQPPMNDAPDENDIFMVPGASALQAREEEDEAQDAHSSALPLIEAPDDDESDAASIGGALSLIYPDDDPFDAQLLQQSGMPEAHEATGGEAPDAAGELTRVPADHAAMAGPSDALDAEESPDDESALDILRPLDPDDLATSPPPPVEADLASDEPIQRSMTDVLAASHDTVPETSASGAPTAFGAELEEEMRLDAHGQRTTSGALTETARLRAELETHPGDIALRRRLAESMFEAGDREGGLAELEHAMVNAEHAGRLDEANAVAGELTRIEPGSVRYHQKLVEYAVRSSDKGRLAEAYLSLADCLLRGGEMDKARAVYGRVIELAPNDARAQTALRTLGGDELVEPAPPPPAVRDLPPPASPPRVERRVSTPRAAPAAPRRDAEEEAARESAVADQPADADFVNLADWLREDENARSTRMVADVGEPRDQQQVDFAEMLTMFKQGVAANVDETDHESHYDLGVAYKEMGLLDEAISEFQKALRGTEQRVRTYEALGQCFVEKRQYQIALTILSRSLNDQSYSDDMLVGVLYLLGYASEALGRWQDAMRFYERVFAVDIQFRDIGDRLAAVERRAR